MVSREWGLNAMGQVLWGPQQDLQVIGRKPPSSSVVGLVAGLSSGGTKASSQFHIGLLTGNREPLGNVNRVTAPAIPHSDDAIHFALSVPLRNLCSAASGLHTNMNVPHRNAGRDHCVRTNGYR
jgi:hypothetical protein